jgi:hypothetical protein
MKAYMHDLSTFRCREYSEYLTRPNPKAVESVEEPYRYNGKILSDFDDYEDDIIEQYRETDSVYAT